MKSRFLTFVLTLASMVFCVIGLSACGAPNIEQFVERLKTLYPEIEYVNHLMTHSWGQKVVRFYDLDGNLIEVGTPL